MIKRFILLFLAVTAMITSSAMTPYKEVQPYEFGLRLGPTYPLGSYKDVDNKNGINVGLDFRFNYDDTPIDFGVSLDLASIRRNRVDSQNYIRELNHTNAGITLTCNYNFKQGYKINPYAGIGLGYGGNIVASDNLNIHKSKDYNSILVTPRVGVELIYHIRFELETMISRSGFNCLNLTVGFVIGGRPRK